MTGLIGQVFDSQKTLWSDPEQRNELIKFTAVCTLASYVALDLFKHINLTGKEIIAAGFLLLPLLSPEKREVSVLMNASLLFHDRHIKDRNYTPFQIHGAVALGAYIYGSMFSKKKAD